MKKLLLIPLLFSSLCAADDHVNFEQYRAAFDQYHQKHEHELIPQEHVARFLPELEEAVITLNPEMREELEDALEQISINDIRTTLSLLNAFFKQKPELLALPQVDNAVYYELYSNFGFEHIMPFEQFKYCAWVAQKRLEERDMHVALFLAFVDEVLAK